MCCTDRKKEHSEYIHTYAFGTLFILFGQSDLVELEGHPGPTGRRSGDVIWALLHQRRSISVVLTMGFRHLLW